MKKLYLPYALILGSLAIFNTPLQSKPLTKLVTLGFIGAVLYYILKPHAQTANDRVEITEETEQEKIFRTNNDAVYLYAPGFLANATQAGKYTREFVCKETNEIITSKNGIQVLGENVYVVKGNEVDTQQKNVSFLPNPFTWFWHNMCYEIAGRANNGF